MEQTPDAKSPRTPTPYWAGLALSKTSPFALEPSSLPQWNHRGETRAFKLNATANALETAPQDRSELSRFTDIHSLLVHLRLEHYISKSSCHLRSVSRLEWLTSFLVAGNFVEHEIDMETFLTLTDKDLVQNLGINAFGARKRLLLAIADMQRPNFSAAPGAERRPSTGW